jgi:outer membrane receptor protein involved in Fe transport
LSNELTNDIESTLIGGMQGFITQETVREIEAERFPGPGYDVTEAAKDQSSTEFHLEEVNAGMFLQEQVGFNGFIFVTVGGRYDVNSAFGSDFNGVFYPKTSLSVVPTDASFWESGGIISSLRIRGAIGQSGLQPGAFDALTTYSSIAAPTGPGTVPQNLGNPELKPEISTEWEVGADVELFNSRFAAEATYWDRTVTDALIPRQYPVSGGFLATQLDNIGELKGRGVEVGLDGVLVQSEGIRLSAFANASYLWEQVTDLSGAPPIKAGYYRYRNFVKEDYAPGAFFGPRLVNVEAGHYPVDTNGDGEPDSEQELRNYLSTLTPESADIAEFSQNVMLQDQDGDGDKLDHYKGKPQPDWQGTFGLDFSWNNLTVSTMFEYQTGNVSVQNLMGGFRKSSAYQNTMVSRRTERNFITGGVNDDYQPQNNTDARLKAANKWITDILSMAPYSGLNVIQPADFVRWRELSVTYDIPWLAKKLDGKNASLTIGARNLWMSTLYPGVDPEQNVSGRGASGNDTIENNFVSGVEHTNMPLPLRLQFSLRIGI